MSRIQNLRAVRGLILVMLFTGCGQGAKDEVDSGTFNKSVYSNKYFGLTITVPEKWSVQDQEAQRRLMKVGVDMVAGSDKNLKAALNAIEPQSVTLFAVFVHPLGAPVPFNASITGVAEKVRDMPGIRRGKDYHFQVRQTLEAGQIQISFPRDDYTERLAGVDFDVMELEMKARGMAVRQKYCTVIKKGYALTIILSFVTDEDEAPLRKVLETLKFN